ncbi:MAG TPA: hypothetical protein VH142_22940 [Polyangiaceae bacterium]|jgi:hypothetical protein|nr:hypothetical protein [Polyangiaceae bacterium]
MATSTDDLEAYLTRLDRKFEKVDAQTYLVSLGPNSPVAVLRVASPVVVVQVEVGVAPSSDASAETKLFRKLLELNATDLLHAAYGIEGNRIVLSAALELASMDIGELEAVLANIDMAIAEHVPSLRELAK